MTKMLKTFLAAVLAGTLFAASIDIVPSKYLDHVKYLASDELKGRGNGTPELDKAAKYLAAQFKAIGIKPAFDGSYLQPFPLTTNAKLGDNNRFVDTTGKKLALDKDYTPLNFSSSGKVSGDVVFAGYGITAAEYNYDDYAGIDVKGKIVLLLRYEPQETDEKSVFLGKNPTRHATLADKATNAKMHGAKGVVMIQNRATHPEDKLERFGRTAGPNEAGIPFVMAKAGIGEAWIEASGRKLADVIAAIDRDLKPQSFALASTVDPHLEVDVRREIKTVHNVGAYLPGETDEYVVIGAHYDHLGLGEQYSLAPSQIGKPHLGADDNASGAAGVVELARWFAKQPKQKRGILFLSFAGEELGLLGSSYFTEHNPLGGDKAAAMLNMDMIGRLNKEGSVVIGGAASGSSLKQTLEAVARRHSQLKLDYSEQGGGGSDHTSFITKRVPSLFFFTGLHGDYHRPSDTWDKINAEGAAQVLAMVADVATELAAAPERPQFVKVADAPRPGGAGSGGGGYGPSFGSVPDMAFSGKGVRFSDLREGSPAAKAGLKAGDIMVEFDQKPIENLYDFTYALRGRMVGDTIVVRVLRNGAPVTVNVLLEARK